uniref:Uncharacterized protein n=1 Tax=Arundo donax TaxID=35708 RepID=A0A0A9CKT8_ARUDO
MVLTEGGAGSAKSKTAAKFSWNFFFASHFLRFLLQFNMSGSSFPSVPKKRHSGNELGLCASTFSKI